jgi:hypothetical protein
MRTTVMRPTFAVDLTASADEAIERICTVLQANPDAGRAIWAGRCADLFVADLQRRIWSPRLSLHVEEAHDGCTLHGRFSPRPEIWTFLMFLYFLNVTVVFFAAMLGSAQWMIGERMWGFGVAVAGVLVIVLLHAASLIGQRLGHEQMQQLRKRLDDALLEAFPIDSQPRGLDTDSEPKPEATPHASLQNGNA